MTKTAFTILPTGLFCRSALGADVKVTSLRVSPKLKPGVPYHVTMPYRLKGTITSVEGCFLWSGEGPYCFRRAG